MLLFTWKLSLIVVWGRQKSRTLEIRHGDNPIKLCSLILYEYRIDFYSSLGVFPVYYLPVIVVTASPTDLLIQTWNWVPWGKSFSVKHGNELALFLRAPCVLQFWCLVFWKERQVCADLHLGLKQDKTHLWRNPLCIALCSFSGVGR